MPRAQRAAVGGMVYHVLNRANARLRLFDREEEYELFEQVLTEAHEQVPIRTLAFCVMSKRSVDPVGAEPLAHGPLAARGRRSI